MYGWAPMTCLWGWLVLCSSDQSHMHILNQSLIKTKCILNVKTGQMKRSALTVYETSTKYSHIVCLLLSNGLKVNSLIFGDIVQYSMSNTRYRSFNKLICKTSLTFLIYLFKKWCIKVSIVVLATWWKVH